MSSLAGIVTAKNFISSSTITDSGAGTLILTLLSDQIQTLTGTSAPIVRLPDTTTLSLGHSFTITNLSDVQVRVDHSGSTEVRRLPTSGTGIFTCIDTGTNVPASWQYELNDITLVGQALPAIRTVSTGTYTMLKTDTSIIFTVSCVVTLYSAAALIGKVVCIKATAPVVVNSASANVVPADSATPGTAILSGADGEHIRLQSDGTNWVIMQKAIPGGATGSSGGPTAIQLSDGSGDFTNDADLTWTSSTNTLTLGSGSEIVFSSDQVAIGSSATTVAGNSSISIGASATTNADTAIAIGPNASATGNNSIAYGRNTSASNDGAICMGYANQANGQNSICMGLLGQANQPRSIAIGQTAGSFASGGIVIGGESSTTAINGISISNGVRNSGPYGTAIGYQANIAGGTDSVCVGGVNGGYQTGYGSDCIALNGSVGFGTATSPALAVGGFVTENGGIAIGHDASADPWQSFIPGMFFPIQLSQGPFAIGSGSHFVPGWGFTPLVARLRVNINGVNRTIPLYADH